MKTLSALASGVAFLPVFLPLVQPLVQPLVLPAVAAAALAAPGVRLVTEIRALPHAPGAFRYAVTVRPVGGPAHAVTLVLETRRPSAWTAVAPGCLASRDRTEVACDLGEVREAEPRTLRLTGTTGAPGTAPVVVRASAANATPVTSSLGTSTLRLAFHGRPAAARHAPAVRRADPGGGASAEPSASSAASPGGASSGALSPGVEPPGAGSPGAASVGVESPGVGSPRVGSPRGGSPGVESSAAPSSAAVQASPEVSPPAGSPSVQPSGNEPPAALSRGAAPAVPLPPKRAVRKARPARPSPSASASAGVPSMGSAVGAPGASHGAAPSDVSITPQAPAAPDLSGAAAAVPPPPPPSLSAGGPGASAALPQIAAGPPTPAPKASHGDGISELSTLSPAGAMQAGRWSWATLIAVAIVTEAGLLWLVTGFTVWRRRRSRGHRPNRRIRPLRVLFSRFFL